MPIWKTAFFFFQDFKGLPAGLLVVLDKFDHLCMMVLHNSRTGSQVTFFFFHGEKFVTPVKLCQYQFK